MEHLTGSEVIITEKLDGENTSLHTSHIHARSLEDVSAPWRHMIKKLHSCISYKIPENIQICGENVYAKHSIFYDKLTDYFYVFGAIDKEKNCFLSITDTLALCEDLNLEFVPILYKGVYPPNENFFTPFFGEESEGYVVRRTESIPVESFDTYAAKYVRKNHVQCDAFWQRNWTPNLLNENIKPWYL